MQRRCLLAGGFMVFTLLVISCNGPVVYDDIVRIEQGKWQKDYAAGFEVNIEDTVSLYNFYVDIRNTTDYRYSNLFIFLTSRFPNDNRTLDTIEFVLAKPSGEWLGKGWSNVKETETLLKSNLRFPLKGKYDFFVQQAMREDTLEGINSVGIKIEKISE